MKALVKIFVFTMLIESICFHGIAASRDSLERMPLASGIDAYFCNGEFDKVIKLASEIKPSDVGYVSAQLYSVASDSLKLNVSALNLSDDSLAKMAPLDRLLLAAKLMKKGFSDQLIIKKILSFHASDPVVEAYRLYHEGVLEQDDSSAKALDKTMKAFSMLPYVDSTLLHEIFLLGMGQKYPLLVLNDFFPYIDSFPKDSSDYNLLMADKNYILSRSENHNPDISFARKAYSSCQYSSDAALFYANLLIREKRYSEAEKVLLPIVEKVPQYSPYADLFLAKIYASLNNKEKAQAFLRRAESHKEYFNKSYRDDIQKLRDEIQLKSYSFYIISILICLFITFVFLKRKKKNKKFSHK